MFKLLFAISLAIHYGVYITYSLANLGNIFALIPLYSTVFLYLDLARDGFSASDVMLLLASASSGFAFWATLVWWNSRTTSNVPTGNTHRKDTQ